MVIIPGCWLDISPVCKRWHKYCGLTNVILKCHGRQPPEDSAPKLDILCPCTLLWLYRLTAWLTTWLYTAQNATFVQNDPEVSY